MAENRLGGETSPYLLEHRDNPVHWQPWDEAALDLARRQNKPILLSIGYSACHWCHVMAEESFADPRTAALMNDLFVNIKVDREERPDLDAVYQAALAELGQTRGWPLTMFLTPQARPYAGGTYYPPEPRYGRPAFRDVLRRMAEAYAGDPAGTAGRAARLSAALESEARAPAGTGVTAAQLNHVAGQLLDGIDVVYGGFGRQPKFPHPMALEVLWRAYRRTGHASFRDAVVRSAEGMCQGGLYDHLGGGFARYSVDEFWLVPHFEKMLYDNALLVDLLTLLWRGTGSALFARRVEETVAWLLREMAAPEGGFAASLSADSAGHAGCAAGEGAFYVWTEAEIDAVLGAEAELFKDHYDVDAEGNWEGRSVLNRSDRPFGADPDIEARLAELCARLYEARERRPRPARDDKVLADWNGLAIAALANAGAAFDRADWVAAAAEAFAFVRARLGRSGRLRHSYRNGRCAEIAVLDDYAHMARAALRLFEATGELAYLGQARDWAAIADEDYWDPAGGGYFLTARDAGAIIVRPKSARETSTPSGNGTMVGVLADLYALSGEDAYRARAEATVAAFSGEIPGHFFALATLLNGSERLHEPVQVVLLGEPASAALDHLRRAVHEAAPPDCLLVQVAPGAGLPAGHPAAGKAQVGGRATAYVCLGPVCRPPVTDAQALRAALRPERAAEGARVKA